jgi:phospholipase C
VARDDSAPKFTRRQVLGAAAAGASALAVTSTTVGRAAGLVYGDPARGFDHVVVVMMENRSFDHMLGWLPGSNGVQAGLSFVDHEGVSHPTWHLDTFQGLGYGDPDHSYTGGRLELNKGQCNGFLQAGTDDVFPIGYYLPEDLAFYSQAAPYWTVCDNFHASIMGPTFPNRFYMHTAQTDRIENDFTVNGKLSQLPTIWDSLRAAGISGTYYYNDFPFVALFDTPHQPTTALYSQFLTDCSSGALPSVSYVDPKFVNEETGTAGDDHPFSDIRVGQAFLNEIYTAVTNSPLWSRTILVITYDEWGGFFDHVVPNRGPDADPTHALRGFRVPTFVITPRARRNHVDHALFDHTSILRMIEWRWGLAPLTVRDAGSYNLAQVLDWNAAPDLTAPQWSVPYPTDVKLPTPAELAASDHQADWLQVGEMAAAQGYPVPTG